MSVDPTATSMKRRRILYALLAGAAIVLTWRTSLTWDSVVDDAYISARYAEHLAEGYGLVYNVGEPPVEGYTNLLWTVLLGLGRAIGLPIVLLMTGMGWLFALASLWLATRVTQLLADESDHPLTTLPAWMIATSPHMAVASTNGLESSMMVAAVLAALWSHMAFRGERRWIAGVCSAALIATRPEGIVVVGGIIVHDLWIHRHRMADAWRLSGIASGFFAALLAWRFLTYGMLLPNTFDAKSSFALTRTFSVNDVYLTPNMHPLLAGLAAWFVGAWLPSWSFRRTLVVGVTLALGIVPLTVTLWMPGLRLFLPALALSVVVFASGLVYLRPWLRWLLGGALLIASLVYSTTHGEMVRKYDWRHSVNSNNAASVVATRLGQAAGEGAWMATRDAGVMAYYVGTNVRVAELHQRALTQHHIDGAHAKVLEYTPTNPDFIVVTQRRDKTDGYVYGNDRQVLQRTTVPYLYLGRVYQHYHRYYDVYARGDLGMDMLPDALVTSFAGPKPPQIAQPGKASEVTPALPDTGL